MLALKAVAVLTCLFGAQRGIADTITIDVVQKYGFSNQGLAAAMKAAATAVANNPNSNVELYIGPGTHILRETATPFDVSGIHPGVGGRLAITGAGMMQTTVVFDGSEFDTIQGNDVHRLTVSDMTFTRSTQTVTQGVCVSVNSTGVVLDIAAGFPSPLDIYDAQSGQGRFLRAYTTSKTDPHLVVDPSNNETVWPPTSNWQVPWDKPVFVGVGAAPGSQRWLLTLRPGAPDSPPAYHAGDLVAVKSKHQMNAYFLAGGDDIIMQRIRWLRHSRGVIRGGISNIVVDSCVVERDAAIVGQTTALATPGGGPQLGQPADPPIFNVTVRNHTAVGTGDDSVALFNVQSGSVESSHIRDSFVRGILLCGSPNVALDGNTLLRCPVFNTTVC
jgi:hypothetical protein